MCLVGVLGFSCLDLFFVCMCVYLCKYMPHVWGFPQSSEEDVGPLEQELTGLCELPDVGTGN